MMKVSNPIFSLAATALLVGINFSLQSARANETDSPPANETDSAPADKCLVVRPAATPKGQHWYFRTERGRKCWSLHAGGPHHAAAKPHSKAATSAKSTAATHEMKPAAPEVAEPPPPTNTPDEAFDVVAPSPPPTRPQPAPEAASSAATMPGAAVEAAPGATAVPVAGAPPPAGAGVQPQPHIEILRTEPVVGPTQQAAQPSSAAAAPEASAAQAPAAQTVPATQAAQPSAPAAPEAPAAQAAPAARGGGTADGNATSTDNTDTVPSKTGSEAKDATSAVPEAGPDAERGQSDAAQQEPAETPGLVNTIALLQPTEMFFIFAIGLNIVVFLVAIAIRIAAKRREPIITEYLDSAWSNDQFDPPRLEAPQFAHKAMNERWTDEQQHVPFSEPRELDNPHQQEIRQPELTHTSTAALSALRSPSDSKSLEPVLRILRQS